ncbi:unnamed protein product [Macrosiphum euphorbiae]|uniref:Uncharacterized protein n=1 Tax=Macrosiphum euphorbiae TaxID=13131 RepID=A0AAV0XIV6_9HEMI|nr:unnamed protein product [Macrosiphum euphorbiae]
MDHNNDSRSFQIGCRVVPLPLNVICGDQAFDENTKQEIVDSQVFNSIIKEEITDETDRNNDSELLHISSGVLPLSLDGCCVQEFNGIQEIRQTKPV